MLLPRSHGVLRSISGVPVSFRHPLSRNSLFPNVRIHGRPLSALACRPPHGRPSLLFHDSCCSRTFQRPILRGILFTRGIRQKKPINNQNEVSSKSVRVEEPDLEYKRTDKAEAAKAVDLSARLKDRNAATEKGEVLRLLKLAGREWKTLGCTHQIPYFDAFNFLYCSGNCPSLYFLGGSNVSPLLNRQNNRHRNIQSPSSRSLWPLSSTFLHCPGLCPLYRERL